MEKPAVWPLHVSEASGGPPDRATPSPFTLPLLTEALQDKLAKRPNPAENPWTKFARIAAKNPEMVVELKRLEQIVDENFEQIEEEEW
jgi:hypothetical protein